MANSPPTAASLTSFCKTGSSISAKSITVVESESAICIPSSNPGKLMPSAVRLTSTSPIFVTTFPVAIPSFNIVMPFFPPIVNSVPLGIMSQPPTSVKSP